MKPPTKLEKRHVDFHQVRRAKYCIISDLKRIGNINVINCYMLPRSTALGFQENIN